MFILYADRDGDASIVTDGDSSITYYCAFLQGYECEFYDHLLSSTTPTAISLNAF
jgi:hypothetical protein